jgi:hypothetical protein
VNPQIEPKIQEPTHPKLIAKEKRLPLILPDNFSISPFPKLTEEECKEDWGKEYRMALAFANDFDLYRAVTGFKRAIFLLPQEKIHRRMEIEYSIALSYYLGKKYGEAVYEVESSSLICVDMSFPAFEDLLVILYDSYDHLGRNKERDHILSLMENENWQKGDQLCLYRALSCADFPKLCEGAKKKESLNTMLYSYQKGAKSVLKAEILNAILPGAGYWYVGQKETAFTALIVNSLFIGAAVAFFEYGNAPAALITLSLESGWYFGGIYGGGLAAKFYNEHLYANCVQKLGEREKLFPLMMLRYSF